MIVLLPVILGAPAFLGVALTALLAWLMQRGKRGTEKQMFALGLLSTGMGYLLGLVSFKVILDTDWIESLVPFEGMAFLAAWYFGCFAFGMFMMLCSAAWCWVRPRNHDRQPQSEDS